MGGFTISISSLNNSRILTKNRRVVRFEGHETFTGHSALAERRKIHTSMPKSISLPSFLDKSLKN